MWDRKRSERKSGSGLRLFDSRLTNEGCILGSEEFVDETIHRMGEIERSPGRRNEHKSDRDVDADKLFAAVEEVCEVPREVFCSSSKAAKALLAREALIACGRQAGASSTMLAMKTGPSSSTVSNRHDVPCGKCGRMTNCEILPTRYYMYMKSNGENRRIEGLILIFFLRHRSGLRHTGRAQPGGLHRLWPARHVDRHLTAADTFEAAFANTASATAEVSAKIREGMIAVRILDGIVKNIYSANVGKLATWVSASHVEKAPDKKETPPA